MRPDKILNIGSNTDQKTFEMAPGHRVAQFEKLAWRWKLDLSSRSALLVELLSPLLQLLLAGRLAQIFCHDGA
jgi:hypothetical protein